jgi:hypothetical protein
MTWGHCNVHYFKLYQHTVEFLAINRREAAQLTPILVLICVLFVISFINILIKLYFEN